VEINPNGTLRIRGTQAVMGYSEALIVVDGVITDDINSVNPNQIHSVQVLKDGSAAIYGSRGGNGVVMITTKMAYETEQARIAARKAEKEAKKAAKKKKE
jgi:TonB-dependent SusC/RagA subfamily outer membrane receptor